MVVVELVVASLCFLFTARMFSRVGRTCLTASAAAVAVGAGGLLLTTSPADCSDEASSTAATTAASEASLQRFSDRLASVERICRDAKAAPQTAQSPQQSSPIRDFFRRSLLHRSDPTFANRAKAPRAGSIGTTVVHSAATPSTPAAAAAAVATAATAAANTFPTSPPAPPKSAVEPYVVRIALTGGPCAGKSSALAVLTEKATAEGFDVYVGPETATVLMNSGFRFPTDASDPKYDDGGDTGRWSLCVCRDI